MVPPFTREEQERRLSKLVEASVMRSPYEVQIFWNKDLGLPHSEEEGRLSKEALARAQSLGGFMQGPRDLGYDGANLVTAGIDSASTRNLHMRISEHIGERKKRRCSSERSSASIDLSEMMNWYNVTFACIDHLPEGRLARSLAEKFPGGSTSPASSRPHHSTCSCGTRNSTRRGSSAPRRSTRRSPRARGSQSAPADWPEDYVSHMRAASRFHEVDEVGSETVGYKKLGPDDYLLAEVYDLMGTELWWGLESEAARWAGASFGTR